MRIGVIRGDMPGPIHLADVETVSQFNPPTEPMGQTRAIGRPDPTTVGVAMANVPASIESSGDITFPLVINAGNQTLRLRTATSGAYTVVTVAANAGYATLAALLVAVDAALVAAGVAVVSEAVGTLRLRLKSTATGPGATVETDSVANGSTFNTPSELGAAAVLNTVPTAAAVITACLPVGGPLDVSTATLQTTINTGMTTGMVTAIADSIAPRLIETEVAKRSVQVGMLHEYLSASFNPDSRRLPALPNGAAITVVQDDGVTPVSFPVPNVAGAAVGGGVVTITGTGLGSNERDDTVVRFTGAINKVLEQKAIVAAGGSVSSTTIVIPDTLVPGVAATTSSIRVRVDTLASNSFTLT